jgi:hypothetical protein
MGSIFFSLSQFCDIAKVTMIYLHEDLTKFGYIAKYES